MAFLPPNQQLQSTVLLFYGIEQELYHCIPVIVILCYSQYSSTKFNWLLCGPPLIPWVAASLLHRENLEATPRKLVGLQATTTELSYVNLRSCNFLICTDWGTDWFFMLLDTVLREFKFVAVSHLPLLSEWKFCSAISKWLTIRDPFLPAVYLEVCKIAKWFSIFLPLCCTVLHYSDFALSYQIVL